MITYCTNIHPGETWREIFASLKSHLVGVKEKVSPGELFPIGLRLSNRAAMEIDQEASAQFLGWLEETGCFVPTINAFPYGAFHCPGIKETVYLPDWRSPERVAFSKRAADLLASWLPEGRQGTISTVPAGFKSHLTAADYGDIRRNLREVLEHIEEIKQKKGKHILLSLEPEPGCVLETAADIVAFFDIMAFPETLRANTAICLDCCHQAVEFEEAPEFLTTLSRASIGVGKVHVSSGLRFPGGDRGILSNFTEPRYLHQVVVKSPAGSLSRYKDTPDALTHHRFEEGEEWRVHFHVPVYAERTAWSDTTQDFIGKALPLLPPDILLEIETYTWQVMPRELRAGTVTRSIVKEVEWLKSKVSGYGR